MLHYLVAQNQVHPLGRLSDLAQELHLQHLTEKEKSLFLRFPAHLMSGKQSVMASFLNGITHSVLVPLMANI